MKVKVNVKHVPLNQVEYFLNEALSEALADLDAAHREIERLVQENKELRLAESRALSDKKKAESDLAALKKKFSDTCAERDELLGQIAAHKMGLDKKEIEDWKATADELAKKVVTLESEKNEAHARIDELQKLLVDASDTITTLKTQIELRPKFANLWSLLQENGLIVNTEEGPHNNG